MSRTTPHDADTLVLHHFVIYVYCCKIFVINGISLDVIGSLVTHHSFVASYLQGTGYSVLGPELLPTVVPFS